MNIDKQALGKAVDRYMNGDGKAFEEIYNLTNDSAYYTALKIVKNEDDALDIVQESYMTVLKKISTLDKPESFMSWFNMIVANNSRMLLRKNNPMLFEDLSPDSEDGELSFQDMIEDEDTEFIPGADIEQEELRDGIKKLVDGLSPDKRAVVILHYYNNLSVAEIAKALKISENTVKTRLFYSRKDLKAGIEALEKKNAGILGIAPMALVRWALNMDSLGAGSDMPSPAEFISRFQDAAAHGTSVFEKIGGKFSELFGDISQKIHSLFDSGFDPKPVAAVVVTAGIVVGGVAAGTKAVKNNQNKAETTVAQTTVSGIGSGKNNVVDNRDYVVNDEDDRNFVLIDKEDKNVDMVVGSEDMEYGNRGIIENYELRDGDEVVLEDNVALMDRSHFSAEYRDLLPAALKNTETYSARIGNILNAVNSERSGMKPLKNNPRLTEQASVRAEEIAHSGLNFSTRPDGTEYTTMFAENGFDSGTMLECRAYGYSDEKTAMGKIKSDFADALKDPEVTDIGVGVALEPQSETYVYVIHLYSRNGSGTNSNLSAAERFRYNLVKRLYEIEGRGVALEDKNEKIDETVSDIPVIGELSRFDIPIDGIIKSVTDFRERTEKGIVEFLDNIRFGG